MFKKKYDHPTSSVLILNNYVQLNIYIILLCYIICSLQILTEIHVIDFTEVKIYFLHILTV